MSNYFDIYGRIHDKPVTEKNPLPSNNSFLYSGEAHLAGIEVDVVKVLETFKKCSTKYGYNRNPDNKSFPASSHDEIVGLFMLMTKVGANHLYKELESQHFQVCNLEGFEPKPLYKFLLSPIKTYRAFRSLSREINPRKETHRYPEIWPIIFKHAPQHTYFYKRCAGLRPSLFHSLFSFCAGLHTIYRGSNSSRVLFGFKLLKLKKMGQSFSEKLLTKLYNRKLEFGTEVKMYFPDDHPIALKVGDKL